MRSLLLDIGNFTSQTLGIHSFFLAGLNIAEASLEKGGSVSVATEITSLPKRADESLPWVRELAEEAGLASESVGEMYRAEYARLKAGARLVDFLPILVMSNLKRRIHSEEGRPPKDHAHVSVS